MLTEDLTYWFFRLNGCLTIQNFVVHPDGPGGQRTDADLIAVRFPHRAELLTSGDPMPDHPLFGKGLELFLAEVKTGKCSVNGPWTDKRKNNIQRVLHAVGIIPTGKQTETAARSLYTDGRFSNGSIDIRLVLVGSRKHPTGCGLKDVGQITFDEMLTFIHDRMATYFHEKADHQQWDQIAHELYDTAVKRYFGNTLEFLKYWNARLAGVTR